MVVEIGELPDIVSTQQLSELTGLSPQRLSALRKADVISSFAMGRWEFSKTISALFRHYGEVAAGRGDGGVLDLPQERAKLAKAQERNYALKNAQLEGALVDLADVEELVGAMVGHVRARLLSLPSKLAPIAAMGATQTEFREHLVKGVHEALDDLAGAEVVVEQIRNKVEQSEDGSGSQEVAGASEGTAETDGKRVGRRKQNAVQRGQQRNRKVENKSG